MKLEITKAYETHLNSGVWVYDVWLGKKLLGVIDGGKFRLNYQSYKRLLTPSIKAKISKFINQNTNEAIGEPN